MPIIITSMDMPGYCRQCDFDSVFHGCTILDKDNRDWREYGRPDWCPLQEVTGVCLCKGGCDEDH